MPIKLGPFQIALAIAMLGNAVLTPVASADTTTRSSSIALNNAGGLLYNVNQDANSVTVFEVGKGGGDLSKLDEVGVGREPVCVATVGQKAYVTNAASGTVSVISRASKGFKVVKEIVVGD